MKQIYLVVNFENIQKNIESFIAKSGGANIKISPTTKGAIFNFYVDNIIDKVEFKKRLVKTLTKHGYKSY